MTEGGIIKSIEGALRALLFIKHVPQVLPVGLSWNELALDQDLCRLHLSILTIYQDVFEVVSLLLGAIGPKYSLALAEEGIFVVVSDEVELSIERLDRFIYFTGEAERRLEFLLLIRLGNIKFLIEVLLEVFGQESRFLFLIELKLHGLQLDAIIWVLVEEALEKGEELLPSDLSHFLLGQASIVKLKIGSMLS